MYFGLVEDDGVDFMRAKPSTWRDAENPGGHDSDFSIHSCSGVQSISAWIAADATRLSVHSREGGCNSERRA
jgi:hypothetical protein